MHIISEYKNQIFSYFKDESIYNGKFHNNLDNINFSLEISKIEVITENNSTSFNLGFYINLSLKSNINNTDNNLLYKALEEIIYLLLNLNNKYMFNVESPINIVVEEQNNLNNDLNKTFTIKWEQKLNIKKPILN